MHEMKKETYERSSLTVTEFAQEDVIVTSGIMDTMRRIFSSFSLGDNDAEIFQTR